MTTHPLITDVRPVAVAPRCSQYDGRSRCSAAATVWIVSPDHRAITAECSRHAAAVLDEYAAHAGELAGWYGVPLAVAP